MRLAGLVLLISIGLPSHAAAQDSDLAGDWLTQPSATGNWGGARDSLIDSGITPSAFYITDVLGNPIGGDEQTVAYAGLLHGALDFDLEKLAGLEGLHLNASGSWSSGRNLSDSIGNFYVVAEIFTGTSVRLSTLNLEQSLWGDALNVKLGRVASGKDFAASPLYDNYVSGAINGNLLVVGANMPSFNSSTFGQWGARVAARPLEEIEIKLGAYNADPSVKADNRHGVDFSFNPGDGVLSMASITYRLNQAKGDSGLPGNYLLGGYFDSSDFPRLDQPTPPTAPQPEVGGFLGKLFGTTAALSTAEPQEARSSNYGLYVQIDQMVYREGEASGDQGLTPWIFVNYAPLESINPVPLAVAGGAVYRGLIPGRNRDVTVLGAFYADFSDDLAGQTYELALEANHRFQIAPWLYVTPDLQYIIRPGGTGDISNALVIGAELSLTF